MIPAICSVSLRRLDSESAVTVYLSVVGLGLEVRVGLSQKPLAKSAKVLVIMFSSGAHLHMPGYLDTRRIRAPAAARPLRIGMSYRPSRTGEHIVLHHFNFAAQCRISLWLETGVFAPQSYHMDCTRPGPSYTIYAAPGTGRFFAPLALNSQPVDTTFALLT
jgi:hypothetical protein